MTKKLLLITAFFLSLLSAMGFCQDKQEEQSEDIPDQRLSLTQPPLLTSSSPAPYRRLTQFVFCAREEETHRPLSIDVTIGNTHTSQIVEIERQFAVHLEPFRYEGIRLVIDDREWTQNDWSFDDIVRIFHKGEVTPEERKVKLNTLLFTVAGKRVPFSWDYSSPVIVPTINYVRYYPGFNFLGTHEIIIL